MIYIESLELHVSNHCNLSCRGCSHLTPLESPCFIDLNTTLASLKILKEYVHCKVIRLLGGEPTLNPNLCKIVDEIKKIGIADEISISTNGILLNKISDDTLKNVNMIEISNYNYSSAKTNEIINWSKAIKKKYKHLKIIIYMYQYFREPYSYIKNTDSIQVQKIYKSCIVAQKWQCFNVYENYIFKCPEAMALSKNIENESFSKNGVKIANSKNFENELENYLFNEKSLSACQYCLGTTGKLFPIEQTTKEKYKKYANFPTKDLIDNEFLDECIKNDIGDLKTVREIVEI